MAKKSFQPDFSRGYSPLLIAVGASLAVVLVFLILPLAGGLQDRAEPDVTVRDVDLIELPEPPEELQPEPESTQETSQSKPTRELSQAPESPSLTPLAVEEAGPPMPVTEGAELGVPEFPVTLAPASLPETFSLNEVDVRPMPLVQSPPTYPWELRRARAEGEAVMSFTIDAEGRTGDIVVESASHESFGQAAREAIQKWRYRPAQRNAQPVACTVRIAVPFQLR